MLKMQRRKKKKKKKETKETKGASERMHMLRLHCIYIYIIFTSCVQARGTRDKKLVGDRSNYSTKVILQMGRR